jgi:hypothetical protein
MAGAGQIYRLSSCRNTYEDLLELVPAIHVDARRGLTSLARRKLITLVRYAEVLFRAKAISNPRTA